MTLYALIGPDGAVHREATNVTPNVPTKPGWKWLPVEDSDSAPESLPTQRTERTETIEADRVKRGWAVVPRTIVSADVNAERDRRMAVFVFGGKSFDFDERSAMNIAGAATLALAAIINGAQPGDMRWSDANADFGWFAQDNTRVTMDAQTMFAFGQAAASWRSGCIHAARTLKDQSPIPADFTANVHWPA